jgi:hypothetical protein
MHQGARRDAQNSESDAARVATAVALLDRGWGRPPQAHTGPDGDGEIRVIIRHIVEGDRHSEPRWRCCSTMSCSSPRCSGRS